MDASRWIPTIPKALWTPGGWRAPEGRCGAIRGPEQLRGFHVQGTQGARAGHREWTGREELWLGNRICDLGGTVVCIGAGRDNCWSNVPEVGDGRGIIKQIVFFQ